MKKTYIEPSVKVHIIKPCQMICTSLNEVSGLKGVTKGEGDFGGGVSDGRRSRFSKWEDDYYEE